MLLNFKAMSRKDFDQTLVDTIECERKDLSRGAICECHNFPLLTGGQAVAECLQLSGPHYALTRSARGQSTVVWRHYAVDQHTPNEVRCRRAKPRTTLEVLSRTLGAYGHERKAGKPAFALMPRARQPQLCWLGSCHFEPRDARTLAADPGTRWHGAQGSKWPARQRSTRG